MAEGGVAPLLSSGSASVTSVHLGGLEEKFAFARAISRLYEMSRASSNKQCLTRSGGRTIEAVAP